LTSVIDRLRGLTAAKAVRAADGSSSARSFEPSFDWRGLLAPVPGERPTGEAAHIAGDYQRIEDARRHDDPALPQGVWQHDLRRADWTQVAKLCTDALLQRGKDLQVAAWLIDARMRLDGPAALCDGFDLLHGLVQRFWPDLHPEIEADGDLSARLAPIEWINHKLPALLYEMPITRPGDDGAPAWSWTDYANAQRLERLRARDTKQAERAESRGAVNVAAVLTAIEQTPDVFYRQMVAMFVDGARALEAFQAELDARCGAAGAGLGTLRTAIETLLGFARTVLEERGAPEMPEPQSVEPTEDLDDAVLMMPEPQPTNAPAPAAAGTSIRSREDAYRLLSEVAEYLHRTEPHSPTPYLIQRAVSWGSMPLHLLLMELSAGRQDLSLLFELLGITEAEGSTHRRAIPRKE
jgi:type VI secretion system protein ImpA